MEQTLHVPVRVRERGCAVRSPRRKSKCRSFSPGNGYLPSGKPRPGRKPLRLSGNRLRSGELLKADFAEERGDIRFVSFCADPDRAHARINLPDQDLLRRRRNHLKDLPVDSVL